MGTHTSLPYLMFFLLLLNFLFIFVKSHPTKYIFATLMFCLLLFTFYFNFFFFVKSHPTTYQSLQSLPTPTPPPPIISFVFFFFFWSFFEDLKLSSFHGKFSHLLFIFLLSLLLHLLFFLIWLRPSGCCSHKVQFLTLFPLNPNPISSHQDQACRMRWLKWFNILMIFFFQIFVCTVFLHLHLD